MPRKRDEPSLFGDSPIDRAMEMVPPAPVEARSHDLASSLGARVRLGTSSWSFAGWRGFVYAAGAPAAELAAHGLAAYAHQPLHATVALDRAFYETPSVDTLRALAAQVPPSFRFVVKAHQACTRPHANAEGHTLGSVTAARLHGASNAHFLNGPWARDAVVAPTVEGLGSSCGPIIFQFPPLTFGPREALRDPMQLADRLEAFLAALPRGPWYAVEARNESMVRGEAGRRFVAALAAHGAVPSVGLLPGMPGAARARVHLAEAGLDPTKQPALVVRWLLGHGLGYDEAKRLYEPFDRLAAPDPTTRAEIAALVAACTAAGGESFVIINNKAEGSAPRSIPVLAESILAARANTPIAPAPENRPCPSPPSC